MCVGRVEGNREALNAISRTGGQTTPKAHEWNDVVIVAQWRLQQSKGNEVSCCIHVACLSFCASVVLPSIAITQERNHSSGIRIPMRRRDSL